MLKRIRVSQLWSACSSTTVCHFIWVEPMSAIDEFQTDSFRGYWVVGSYPFTLTNPILLTVGGDL